jgi:hypothetical protein
MARCLELSYGVQLFVSALIYVVVRYVTKSTQNNKMISTYGTMNYANAIDFCGKAICFFFIYVLCESANHLMVGCVPYADAMTNPPTTSSSNAASRFVFGRWSRIFFKDTPWKVYRFHRRKAKDGQYNAKKTTTPHHNERHNTNHGYHDTNAHPANNTTQNQTPKARLASSPAKNGEEAIHQAPEPHHAQWRKLR